MYFKKIFCVVVVVCCSVGLAAKNDSFSQVKPIDFDDIPADAMTVMVNSVGNYMLNGSPTELNLISSAVKDYILNLDNDPKKAKIKQGSVNIGGKAFKIRVSDYVIVVVKHSSLDVNNPSVANLIRELSAGINNARDYASQQNFGISYAKLNDLQQFNIDYYYPATIFVADRVEGQFLPDSEPVYMVVDVMPEFPGGLEALGQYLSENITYPTIAQENGIQGRVIVQFVVYKDGSVGGAKVIRRADPLLDQEAVRLVENMPQWSPGRKEDGTPVNCFFTVPVNFVLTEE